MLPRSFYLVSGLELAPRLLGQILCSRTPEGVTKGRIVEVEAYLGPDDRGAHSYGGVPTPRTQIQYGPGGYSYVFLIYGMHSCMNVVAAGPGQPEVVLLRALEPLEGQELMAARRKSRDLCAGPGKLCKAMGITKAWNGLDLCGDQLWMEAGEPVPPENIALSPRVNIDYAGADVARPWRFFVKDSPFVSKVPARFAPVGTLAEKTEGFYE